MSAIPTDAAPSSPSVLASTLHSSTAEVTALTSFFAAAQPYLDKITRAELAFLLTTLFTLLLLIITCLHFLSRQSNPLSVATRQRLSAATSPTVVWLCLSAVVHLWFELHYVFFRETSSIFHSMNLYAAADFRYGLPLESGTAAMESITALIVGPLCLLLAHAIVTHQSYRYPLQIVVSVCQIYGLSWFVLHGVFAVGPVASSDPFLFWCIFVGLNAPWGIIPPILLWQAWRALIHQHRLHIENGADPDLARSHKRRKLA